MRDVRGEGVVGASASSEIGKKEEKITSKKQCKWSKSQFFFIWGAYSFPLKIRKNRSKFSYFLYAKKYF